jgi:hypothetical protein
MDILVAQRALQISGPLLPLEMLINGRQADGRDCASKTPSVIDLDQTSGQPEDLITPFRAQCVQSDHVSIVRQKEFRERLFLSGWESRRGDCFQSS